MLKLKPNVTKLACSPLLAVDVILYVKFARLCKVSAVAKVMLPVLYNLGNVIALSIIVTHVVACQRMGISC